MYLHDINIKYIFQIAIWKIMTLYNVQGNYKEAANHIEGESNEVNVESTTKEGETDRFMEEGEIEPVDGSFL